MHFVPTQPHRILTAITLSAIVLVQLFVFAGKADAVANPQINYQGKLTNASNVAVADGTYNMRFWLMTSSSVAATKNCPLLTMRKLFGRLSC